MASEDATQALGTRRDMVETCDWCGDPCHCNAEYCVELACGRCDSKVYHTACVEKFLKKMGLPSNRMTGYPCPFGKGKASSVECKGKIDRSHPIVPKNEKKKKARSAPVLLEAMAKQPKATNTAGKAPAPKPPVKAPAARKLPPPKLHQVSTSVSRPLVNPSAGPSVGNVWGQKSAAPVLASAHLPAPAEDPESAGSSSQGPRSPDLTVGLVLEEALSKGSTLTKAQKKNLARRKQREGGAGLDAASSEASSDHQETMAALLGAAPGDASPSGLGATAAGGGGAAVGLVGFDGTALVVAREDLLAQQGHRFITNASEYARLLGLYCGDDSEEEEDEDEEQPADEEGPAAGLAGFSLDGVDASAHAYAPDIAPASLPLIAPVVAPVAVPVAVAPVAVAAARRASPEAEEDYRNNGVLDALGAGAAAAAGAKDAATEEDYNVMLNAAVAESIKTSQLEEEMRRQCEMLTAGGFSAMLGKPAPPSYLASAQPAVVVVPVGVPVAAPSVLFDKTKQQPEVPAASYGGGGWVFGGGNQGGALPPHIPVGYAPLGSMAAGHCAPEVAAADEDDDDLDTLLALCGVAG